DKDPEKHSDAVKFDQISFMDVLHKQLKVMDLTAISLCMENNLPIMVFNLFEDNSIMRALKGENVGTIIQ
nr:UMP kinase [Spirochaetota bacterium]